MAITIYGCVDWADGGKIKFTNGDCLTISDGCIHFDGGIHDGQVEITITNADKPSCNDTYYGCVNWATGKFQVIIPDDCCAEMGNACDYCEDADPYKNNTPTHITLQFSGLVTCTDCLYYGDHYKFDGVAEAINGTQIVLPQHVDSSCFYSTDSIGSRGVRKLYHTAGCTWWREDVAVFPNIDVWRYATYIEVKMQFSVFRCFLGTKEKTGTDPCLTISGVPNDVVAGDCITWNAATYGGTVDIYDGDIT